MSEPANLFSIARNKLNLSIGSKDNYSLHRWVLLKNSIINSPSSAAPSNNATHCPNATNSVYSLDDDSEEDQGPDETDSFMFPDAGKLVESRASDGKATEAEWLDSLLETLGDDDDEDFGVDSEAQTSVVPADDDEDHLLLSPIVSPMASSDDLSNQSNLYPHPISVTYSYPYPVPYPPLLNSYDYEPSFDSPLSSLPAPYDDPLPYHDSDDLSVPDAIEDTSDDESDAPLTPSLGRSSNSLSLIDPASIPLPPERSSLRRASPHIHVDADDSYFYPFEIDPLPFPDTHNSYNTYQEC